MTPLNVLDYQDEVTNIFKNYFIKYLNAGKILSFEYLYKKSNLEIGFQSEDIDWESSLRDSLEKWYRDVTFHQYLNTLSPCPLSEIEEIIIHSNGLIIFKTFNQHFQNQTSLQNKDIHLSFEALACHNQKDWNYMNPVISFFCIIHNRSVRATLVHSSLSPHKKACCIFRFHHQRQLSFLDFKCDKNVEGLMQELILKKKNILISGSTGSGKTSFMRLLLESIPEKEHLITLEDTSELLIQRGHTTSLINQEKKEHCQLKELCRHALRLSPDRLALGEMRGSEAVNFILSMNTGHRGLISTVHANSGIEAISRVSLLFSLYQENTSIPQETLIGLITKNVNYVIHMHKKRVTSIIEIKGCEGVRPIYETHFSQS